MPKILEELEDQFTKYEVARILGARSLQIAMDAPLLLKIPEAELEDINFNPLDIAKKELMSEVLPITVNRPLPKKREGKIKKLTKQEIEELKEKEEKEKKIEEKQAEKEIEAKENKEAPVHAAEIKEDEELIEKEKEEQEKVAQDDEIMELAKPTDEVEEEEAKPEEGM